MFDAATSDAEMSPGERRRDASWGREIGATLSLAWPMILSNLAATALATIDVVLLGRLAPEALAAAALGTNLFNAVLITAIGLVTAVSPLIAAEYGRRRSSVRDIRRSVQGGFWLAMAISIPAWIALSQAETILIALGQQPALAADAGTYLGALMWALLPNLLFVVLRSFMAALGRPGWGLAVALGAMPVNVGLASALIFGRFGAPQLGLIGAGIATAITSLLSVAALALVTLRHGSFRRYRVFGGMWRPDWSRVAALWRVGAPVAVTLAFEVAFFSGIGLLMGTIGAAELAAHTIALQIAAMCFMVPLGIGQAATIRVGHALGAADHRAIAMAGWSAFGVSVAFTLLTASLLTGVPNLLVGAFLDPAVPANAPVAALAVSFLAFAALFQLADAAQVVGAGMLRGLEDTRVPMVYAALGYWGIGTPVGLALAFPFGLRGSGLWIGLATGLAAVALLMLRRWSARARLGLLPGP